MRLWTHRTQEPSTSSLLLYKPATRGWKRTTDTDAREGLADSPCQVPAEPGATSTSPLPCIPLPTSLSTSPQISSGLPLGPPPTSAAAHSGLQSRGEGCGLRFPLCDPGDVTALRGLSLLLCQVGVMLGPVGQRGSSLECSRPSAQFWACVRTSSVNPSSGHFLQATAPPPGFPPAAQASFFPASTAHRLQAPSHQWTHAHTCAHTHTHT